MRGLADLLASLTGRKAGGGFAPDDHRVAVAALLLHAIAIDGRVRAEETKRVAAVMAERFGLERAECDAILAEAQRRDLETSDIGEFTGTLKRALSPEGRATVLAMLRDVSIVDGASHEFEETLIWRVADLLDVPPPAGATTR